MAYHRAMSLDTLREQALDLQDDTVALRRRLHTRPELGNDLPITREAVLESLEGLPLDITLHQSTSGIAALLTGGEPGPTVLLRGDMDALPLHEDTGLDYSSKDDGTMHACGHDTHTAMLASAAKLLSSRRDEIAGRVLFMFQPGEEGEHGARYMLEEGLLDVPPLADGTESPVTGAFALHITSTIPTGMVATKGGPTMASADTFHILVKGAGGHASEPFRTIDPIPIACEIVQALQTMITRRIDIFDPAVVTVGQITQQLVAVVGAPFGAQASCRLPAGRQTKLPAVHSPSSSHRDPSRTQVCSISTCSCRVSLEPGSHLNRAVIMPDSSSSIRIFIWMPSQGVGFQGNAATST